VIDPKTVEQVIVGLKSALPGRVIQDMEKTCVPHWSRRLRALTL
jgi:hypothetical protein